jgi:hypothetical protein
MAETLDAQGTSFGEKKPWRQVLWERKRLWRVKAKVTAYRVTVAVWRREEWNWRKVGGREWLLSLYELWLPEAQID